MKKRKAINDKLVEWIQNKAKNDYAGDISLVVIYGSYINGTANSKSDVDCYYIPKTERGYGFSADFIIGGTGYDIFPIPWERIERIADLQENMSPLVGDVRIIYSDSDSDTAHFQVMQERLKNSLSNDGYVRKTAIKRCEEAGKYCAMLNHAYRPSAIRKLAGIVIMMLADAVAVYNHDYYHFGLKMQFEDLQNNFPDVPRDIIDGYRNVIRAADIDEVIKYTNKMFCDVCRYLKITSALPEILEYESITSDKIDASCLARMFEEIKSTFNKIYICCESGNYILAFLSAVCLQLDLDEAKQAGCPDYDLLGGFNYRELWKLSGTAQRIEDDFVRLITENGGHIKKYGSFEQFEAARL